MAVRKSSGKCTCKSITVIVKMRASLSSNRSEKTYFPPLFDTIIANLHCQILMVIFLSLRAKFTCYQQIKTHTSKYFLVNVWNDFWKCDINFGLVTFLVFDERSLRLKYLSMKLLLQLLPTAPYFSCEP